MPKRALVLIDIQNDYFPGGRWSLSGIEAAPDCAARLPAAARAVCRALPEGAGQQNHRIKPGRAAYRGE